ncbi:MAG: hypothetical protein ABJI00_14275 [Paracoccaceae bacterium]
MKPAEDEKRIIIGQVRQLLVKGIVKARAVSLATALVVDVGRDAPSTKRFEPACDTANAPNQAAFRAAGMVDCDSDDEIQRASEPTKSAEEEAFMLISKWEGEKVGACVAGVLS